MFGNNKERTGNVTVPNSTPQSSSSSSRSNSNAGDSITAYLGPDTNIEGTLRFDASVLIEGTFKGQIISEHGTLVIGESANVEADIQGGHVTIRGKVTGSVTATERVHLQDRGAFSGELTTPSLQMDESVTFDGSCKMPKKGQTPKKSFDGNKGKTEDKILAAVDSVNA